MTPTLLTELRELEAHLGPPFENDCPTSLNRLRTLLPSVISRLEERDEAVKLLEAIMREPDGADHVLAVATEGIGPFLRGVSGKAVQHRG